MRALRHADRKRMWRAIAMASGGAKCAAAGPAVLLAVTLGLAGCAGGAPIENEVAVSGAGFQNIQGEARLTVRTFLPVEGGTRREVIGAACHLGTSLYAADFTTPVRLKLPNFGAQSPELDVACSAGEWSGAARIEIRTDWDYPPGAYGYYGPFYGPPGYYPGDYYGGPFGYWGWPAGAVPRFYYPNVTLMLH